MLWKLIYGLIETDFKLLVRRFTNYLRFCYKTGNYRITDKYKFIVFNYPNMPQYSAFRKIEKESLSKWEQQFLK